MSIEPPSATADSGDAAKTCPSCGASYPSDMLFCPRDATTLVVEAAGGDLIGQIVAERYHVLRKLGEGGMAQVYLAEHVTMGRMCAIKVMQPRLRTDRDAVSRFRREAANAGRINHPNVAAIYDCGETRDQLIYLTMEYVPGDSLAALLKWESPLAPRRAVGIALQIANALDAAHRLDIIHRDLKPENVMIARSKDGDDLVKVVDFGIAKATERGSSQTVTRTGFVVGTLHYMSPEQMIGESIDGRSDLYSLGCILFEMLAGRRLFEGGPSEAVITRRLTEPPPHPRQFNSAVPPDLDRVVMTLLARSRDDRFQCAEQVQDALAGLSPKPSLSLGRRLVTPWRSAHEPVSGTSPAAPPSGERPTRDTALRTAAGPSTARVARRDLRIRLGAAGIAAALVLGVATGAGSRGQGEPPASARSEPNPAPDVDTFAAAADTTAAPTHQDSVAQPATAPPLEAANGSTRSASARVMPSRPVEPSPPRPAPPAEPAGHELAAVREQISSAGSGARSADFGRAYSSIAAAESALRALRTAYPASEDVRELTREYTDAVASVQRACQALVELNLSTGAALPRCRHP